MSSLMAASSQSGIPAHVAIGVVSLMMILLPASTGFSAGL